MYSSNKKTKKFKFNEKNHLDHPNSEKISCEIFPFLLSKFTSNRYLF